VAIRSAGDKLIARRITKENQMKVASRRLRNLRGATSKVGFEALEPRLMLSGGSTGDSIYVLTQPYLAVAGANIGASGQAFVVEIIKPDGSVDTSYNDNVSMSISNYPLGPGYATGTFSVTAKNGIVTFSDLTFDTSGNFFAQFTDASGDP
jgi:hypothetical protein